MNTTLASQTFTPLRLYKNLNNRISKLKQHNYNIKNKQIEDEIESLEIMTNNLTKYWEGSNKNNITSSYIKAGYQIANNLGTLEEHWKEITNKNIHKRVYKENRPLIKIAMKNIKRQNEKTRKYSIQWRLEQHLKWAVKQKYYIIFDTLTIESKYMAKVFEKKSTIWKNYITKFRRTIGIEIYGNKIEADEKFKTEKYHSYFAVTEYGSETGRLHLHVIHTVKNIPQSWKTDPNGYTTKPTKRLINGPQKLWDYGYSYPIAVRINEFDPWGRMNWKWPIKGNKPVKPTNTRQLSLYLVKYITKGATSCRKATMKSTQEQSLIWRTKISRNMGLEVLSKAIQEMQTQQLKALATTTKIMKLNQQIIPKTLIVRTAIKTLMNKLKKRYTIQTLFKILVAYRPQEDIISQIKNLIKMNPKLNYQTFGNTQTRNTSKTIISKFEINMEYYARKYLQEETSYAFSGTSY